MAFVEAGDRFRYGLDKAQNPYLRWGIIEDVYEDDVVIPQADASPGDDVPVIYARSVTVRWLHDRGGRSTVR